MNKRIVVAGAGHGGLAAAAFLAKNGYAVEVYEKRKKEELGYDWHDTVGRDTLRYAGIEEYDKADFHPRKDSTFYAPALRTPVSFDAPPDKADLEIDRKVLYGYLLRNAEEKGAVIRYSANITGPLLDNSNRVAGLLAGDKEIEAELVIDSAGMKSPVMAGLPASYSMKNIFRGNDVFHAYRAYYDLRDGVEIINKDRFNIYFKFNGVKGIAWLKVTRGLADVLIGSAEALDMDKVNETLEKLRKVQPAIGFRLQRGGCIRDIPIKPANSLLVGDRYAAVGDAVSMTVPMNGSGITNSIRAGVMLAETIQDIDKAGKPYGREELWPYQVRYFQEINGKMIAVAVLKNQLLDYPGKVIDFLFDRGILGAKELSAGNGSKELVLEKTEILDKLKKGYKRPFSLLKLKSAAAKSKQARQTAEEIPVVYEKQAVEKWRNELEVFLK